MISDASNSSESNSEEDEDIKRDILRGREFTLADVIRQEGGSFMKGESPVPKLVQVKTEINNFINSNLSDNSGALLVILSRWVDQDIVRVSHHLNHPLQALLGLLKSIVENPPILYELVRQVDMQWGQMNNERPHFQRPGQLPDPNDEYTHESVDHQLCELICCLKSELDQE
ncbi:hypothetical protein M595_5164 [Lyngbya aestuarii BL J]|uniref:Uncharacterized protein n=1 Tax=Lyngbya aestuarii BL J TaxID=1348334 RepID=U7QAR8_9CYAN|nr:hypothetical protein [Lyngbya aestuarii]ERT04893.1 hypothetical protein M595_5164 [Lyngbya aestuarii BL J]